MGFGWDIFFRGNFFLIFVLVVIYFVGFIEGLIIKINVIKG